MKQVNDQQLEGISPELREAAKNLAVVPTESFLLRIEQEITRRGKHAGDAAYAAAFKKVRAQQLAPQQLVVTMLELVAGPKSKRGCPAKLAPSGAASNLEQPGKVAQASDSAKSEEPGVSGV